MDLQPQNSVTNCMPEMVGKIQVQWAMNKEMYDNVAFPPLHPENDE